MGGMHSQNGKYGKFFYWVYHMIYTYIIYIYGFYVYIV